jgi:hypothetical protein
MPSARRRTPRQSAGSPEATGGAGVIAEYRLGAIALAALLCGDPLPGLPVAVTKVAFQQFASGRPLDDLILHGVSGEGNELTIDYQSKRRLTPVASDSDFVEALTACIQTLRGDPEGVGSRRRRLGLAAAAPVTQLTELQKVTEYANSHSSVESLRAQSVPIFAVVGHNYVQQLPGRGSRRPRRGEHPTEGPPSGTRAAARRRAGPQWHRPRRPMVRR